VSTAEIRIIYRPRDLTDCRNVGGARSGQYATLRSIVPAVFITVFVIALPTTEILGDYNIVSHMTSYRLDGRGSIPGRGNDIYLCHHVHTGSGTPARCGQRLESEADHSLPSSIRSSYHHVLYTPPWRGTLVQVQL